MNVREIEPEDSTIDFSKVFGILIKNWYWFLVSAIISISCAYLWNFFSTPIYQVEAKILINDEGSSTFMDPQTLVGQAVFQNANKVRKEMQVLGSYSLTADALKNLPFEADWWYKDGLKSKLVYPPPYRIAVDSSHYQSNNTIFSFNRIDSTRVVISYLNNETEKNVTDTIALGSYFESQSFRFKIISENYQWESKNYLFALNSKENLIEKFNRIELVEEKNSSTILVQYKDPSPIRAADFLESLIQSFLNRGVKRKNQIALNAINFIESQLQNVTDSLENSEERLEEFRRIEGATNLEYQTQKVYELLDELEGEKAQSIVSLNYFNYLQSSIKKNIELNKLVVPSSMGINDVVLNKLVLELIQYYSEKAEITVNSKKNNPMLGAIDYKIEERKRTILETVNGLIFSTNDAIKNLNQRISKYQGEVSKIPEKEKGLLSFQRKFKLNDEIYTYLLTKRSELQIASASNYPENEMLDAPSVVRAYVVYPKKLNSYLFAFFLSFGFPFLIIYLRYQIVDKFEDSSQIEKLGYQVIGELIHSDSSGPYVVNEEHVSVFADSYRLLRTNIKFLVGGGEPKIVLVTSTFPEEGKSYVSRNIAASFAIAGHKTVLVNCDLRKPEKTFLNTDNSVNGLSAYLSKHIDYDNLVRNTEVENLWVISSGLVPPNATELLDSPKMLELIGKLKETFEIIIIDSPPIGVVADSFILAQQSDLLLFVVRYNQSRINGIKRILSTISQKNFKKVAIAANDLNAKYFGYGYQGYNYAYGYNYGSSKKKNWLKKIGW